MRIANGIIMCLLFLAKVVDNALSTAKTILVQRNHCILAGVSLAASNCIYLCVTKNVVNSDGCLALIVVSIASGVGCCLAVAVSNRLSKERTFVNVIMSDDKEKMQAFRDFLEIHIEGQLNSWRFLVVDHKITIAVMQIILTFSIIFRTSKMQRNTAST